MRSLAAASLCALLCAPVAAQDHLPVSEPTASAVTQPAPVEVQTLPACPSLEAGIPKLTPVALVIDAELGSKISTTGDTFPIRLAAPLVVNGCEVLPAGLEGQGEVVHAKKAGGSGTPGELVLAARFLQSGDVRVKLRSMHIAVAGEEAIKQVDALNAAAAGAAVFAPVPLGLVGFVITGKNIVLPKGTLAVAKTAEDFPVSPAAPVAAEQGI